jgi:enoyl-CoA hydratase/carnithine racemase
VLPCHRLTCPAKETPMTLPLLRLTLLATGMAMASMTVAADGASPAAPPAAAKPARQEIRVTKVTPAYWRVTLDNPPFNIFGPETIPQLNAVITDLENDPNVKVVVFESDVPGFFMTHFNFIPPLSDTTSMPVGRTGLPPLPDMLVRLSKAHVVSIAKIRGRATGVGSELALASDMRFASREKAILSHFEVGAGFTPGGGPMARLPRLMGRGRALEVVLGGDDIDGDIAERYGYVNRSLPDAQLDAFVDTLARRIAGFDKQTLGDIKDRVNIASLPPDSELGGEWASFITSVQRPAAQQRIGELMKLGLQKNADIETHLGKVVGQLGEGKP